MINPFFRLIGKLSFWFRVVVLKRPQPLRNETSNYEVNGAYVTPLACSFEPSEEEKEAIDKIEVKINTNWIGILKE